MFYPIAINAQHKGWHGYRATPGDWQTHWRTQVINHDTRETVCPCSTPVCSTPVHSPAAGKCVSFLGKWWIKSFTDFYSRGFFKLALSNLKMNVKMGTSHWRGGQVIGDKFRLKFRALLKEFLEECLYVYVAEMWRQMMVAVYHGFIFSRFFKHVFSNLKMNVNVKPTWQTCDGA